MELSKQTSNRELSLKLRDLGVPQESLFWWSENEHGESGWNVYFQHESLGNEEWFTLDRSVHVSAFTTSELGEMLPRYLLKDGFSLELVIIRSSVWRLHYGQPTQKESIVFTAGPDDTEVDARAKFLIYLIENNLLPTKE